MTGPFEQLVEVRLYELFDKPVKYKWVYQRVDLWGATFEVDGTRFLWSATEDIASKEEFGKAIGYSFRQIQDLAEVGFEIVVTDADSRTSQAWDVKNWDDPGKSLAVIGTSAKIFEEFMRGRRPMAVFFTAKENSRRRAYRTILKRLIRPEYTMFEKDGHFAIVDNGALELLDESTALSESKLRVYRGVGRRGMQGFRIDKDGAYGPGVYFYDNEKSARVYAGRDGGVVVAEVDTNDPDVDVYPADEKVVGTSFVSRKQNIVVVRNPAKIKVLSKR